MENKPHANKCGAKTRSGNPCQNRPMANGRCRMHGGKSTGADPGKMKQNKNAVSHGAYETIWLDTLDDDERDLFDVIPLEVIQQLNDDIRLMTIRERRMMKRIQRLKNQDYAPVRTKQGVEVGKDTDVEEQEAALDKIQAIEDALTKVQEKKARLLEIKHKVEMAAKNEDGGGKPDMKDYLEALKGHMQVWDDNEGES